MIIRVDRTNFDVVTRQIKLRKFIDIGVSRLGTKRNYQKTNIHGLFVRNIKTSKKK